MRSLGFSTPNRNISEFIPEEAKEEMKDDFEDKLFIDSKKSTKKGIGALGSGKKTGSAFSGYNKSERKTQTNGVNRTMNDGTNVMNLSEINIMNESRVSLNQTEFMKFGFK